MSAARDQILVIEDDASLRHLITTLLQGAGYETVEAESGEKGLELARQDRPRLVLLDINLPGTSGYSVCNELRQTLGQQLPIIFLSGERTESFDRVAGLLIGADDYLTKPFDPDELIARVTRMLERLEHQPPQSLEAAGFGLTPRECEVLGLLVEGLSQPDIAERLYLSPKTVGTHIQRIMGKMGVKSRTQAVAVAARQGLFDPLLREARAHTRREATPSS